MSLYMEKQCTASIFSCDMKCDEVMRAREDMMEGNKDFRFHSLLKSEPAKVMKQTIT